MPATEKIPPDVLRFMGVFEKPYLTGWVGPWPPPENLMIAVGKTSGEIVIIEEDKQDPATLAEVGTIARLYRMRLGQHSKLAAEVKNPHLTRCAEYELDAQLLP